MFLLHIRSLFNWIVKPGGLMVHASPFKHLRFICIKIKYGVYSIDVDFSDVYEERFSFLTGQTPKSVMLAEGSAIEVKAGTRCKHEREPQYQLLKESE